MADVLYKENPLFSDWILTIVTASSKMETVVPQSGIWETKEDGLVVKVQIYWSGGETVSLAVPQTFFVVLGKLFNFFVLYL